MLLLNPISIFCALLPFAIAVPAPAPQANVNAVQARQLTRAKIVELAARDPARRATPSSLSPVNRPFRIRFEGVTRPNALDGTYASNPNPPEGPPNNNAVIPGRTFAAAGIFSLNGEGQLVSASNKNIAYASTADDGYLYFDSGPSTSKPAPVKCQIDANNVLTCVKTLNPPAGSATYVCNQVLAYGVCNQTPGSGGPLETTTAVFV